MRRTSTARRTASAAFDDTIQHSPVLSANLETAMPTYEYACRSCGEHLEAVQAFTDDALTTCPNCGGELRKVFRSVGIVFKGSGFYKTDNRSGSSAVSTPATVEPSTKSESSDKSSSEATPAPAAAPSTPAAAPTTP